MQNTSQQRKKLKQKPQQKIKKAITAPANQPPNNNIVPAPKAQTVQPSGLDAATGTITKNFDYFLIIGVGIFFLFVALQKLGILALFKKKAATGDSAETEKGSAHWAKRWEIRKLIKPMVAPKPGDILIGKWNETSFLRLKHKFVVLPRELASRHVLVAAPSGAGKSRTLFLPNLSIGGKQSFLCTDPKSELWQLTSGKQLNPIRFAPMESGTAAFNWIPLCKDVRTAKRCSEAIIHANEGKPDHFWTPGEQDLLTALFSHTASTEQPTPAHVYEILTSGAANISKALMDSTSDAARRTGTGFAEADTKVQTGFVSGLKTKLNWLEDPAIRKFTSSTTTPFSFGSLRHKPTQIYWCLRQSDVSELTPLTALFFNLATLQLLDEDGDIPVTFFYDEFANIGRLNNFQKDITLLRGQKIAVVAGLQSRSQLYSVYGKDNGDIIISQFNNKIMLPGLQMHDAEDFSKMLGEKTYHEVRTSTGSSGKGWFGSSSSKNESLHTSARRLLTAEELRCLPDGVCILYSTNLPPAYLETLFYKEPDCEAKTKLIGAELPVPRYGRAGQVAAPLKGKPPPKLEAKPPAEAETVITARSGKLIHRIEQLTEPNFTVEDLHEPEAEMEILDYEAIHAEIENAA